MRRALTSRGPHDAETVPLTLDDCLRHADYLKSYRDDEDVTEEEAMFVKLADEVRRLQELRRWRAV